MTMIPFKDAHLIREHFARHLTGPVALHFFFQDDPLPGLPRSEGAFCRETAELLGEVAALSDSITLRRLDLSESPDEAREFGVARVPAIVLTGGARGRVRYFGIPSGYEFPSLIEDLVDVARGTTNLPEEVKAFLPTLTSDVHIQVFGTPTCPYCTRPARFAHKLAIESPRVTADIIEVSEFPDLMRRYSVCGVPKVVINESISFEGAQPTGIFLEAIRKAISPAFSPESGPATGYGMPVVVDRPDPFGQP